MKLLLIAGAGIALLTLTIFTSAACYQRYDYRIGDYRTICQDHAGANPGAFNMQYDLEWSDSQDPGGTRSGRGQSAFNQQGNPKGLSFNFATGEMCSGRGLDRICTGGDESSSRRR